jgi:hypothetical protein
VKIRVIEKGVMEKGVMRKWRLPCMKSLLIYLIIFQILLNRLLTFQDTTRRSKKSLKQRLDTMMKKESLSKLTLKSGFQKMKKEKEEKEILMKTIKKLKRMMKRGLGIKSQMLLQKKSLKNQGKLLRACLIS